MGLVPVVGEILLVGNNPAQVFREDILELLGKPLKNE